MKTIKVNSRCMLEAVCPIFREDFFDLGFELGKNILLQELTLQLVDIAVSTNVNL